MVYYCKTCGAEHPVTPEIWKCDCGGGLFLRYEKRKPDFEGIKRFPARSLWKYIDALPFEPEDEAWRLSTMCEGDTPLFLLDPADDGLYAKAEYYCPTLSFKDRGAAVLMAMAKKLGAARVVADSSGNAGTAIAAYGARLGIGCDVFVPAATSDSKISQILAHGANIHKIPGTREATAEAAIRRVEEDGAFYASHIYNPFFYEGTKTYVYEIYEQLGALPEAFIVPVGNGTLLLGAYIAFKELLEWGLINSMPKLIAVQAANCSPIAQAYFAGKEYVEAVAASETLAEGIAIAKPFRGGAILEAVRATGGSFITVDEAQILAARKRMAALGVYVEITSGVNYAAYTEYRNGGGKGAAVLPLCGAGIKSKGI